ncbi:ligase-associated DNA damage response endonuclease PdeM [Pelagibacterium limicola]|uniref:ligase-associated DNA damage response endonuclease PdeM n=1 Tax=Pelagibacterium limicola TaxID=2791022 RepID=UPI0018B0079A|nr:ligase-associated DNA damage response endonuclease PdeM [Pelagibacterium limicola]
MSSAHPLTDGEIITISFRGQSFAPLISGALYWPAHETLLVADLHLEKMASFARSGQFLPPYDTAMTLARLEADIRLTGAKKLIALGDSFHRDEGVQTLNAQDRTRISQITGSLDWVWIAGNHDPSVHRLGGLCVNEISVSGCLLRHEPERGGQGLIAGHLHPAARIAMNGKSTRRPCFVWDDNQLILPAYGASTGSLNILSDAFAGLFNRSKLQVMVMGRDRLYPVGLNRLVRG